MGLWGRLGVVVGLLVFRQLHGALVGLSLRLDGVVAVLLAGCQLGGAQISARQARQHFCAGLAQRHLQVFQTDCGCAYALLGLDLQIQAQVVGAARLWFLFGVQVGLVQSSFVWFYAYGSYQNLENQESTGKRQLFLTQEPWLKLHQSLSLKRQLQLQQYMPRKSGILLYIPLILNYLKHELQGLVVDTQGQKPCLLWVQST